MEDTNEEAGIRAIIALQAIAGIEEPRVKAAHSWTKFTPQQRAQTLLAYSLLCDKGEEKRP